MSYYCAHCKAEVTSQHRCHRAPAESVSPAPQRYIPIIEEDPERGDEDVAVMVSDDRGDYVLHSEYVSLREELAKAKQTIADAGKVLVEDESYGAVIEVMFRQPLAESESENRELRGRLAEARKALETRQRLIHNAQDHQWFDWRKCDEPGCVEVQKLAGVKP